MHIVQHAAIAAVHQSAPAKFNIQALSAQTDGELSLVDRVALQCARSFRFAPDARVAGYLIEADIGPTSYGYLHGADLPPGQNFVTFDAIGVDLRGGYELVRSTAGVAYVILTYAPHAKERGLTFLKHHIGANPDYYAARLLTLQTPWKHTQEMIDQLEAGWKRRLWPADAQERMITLYRALADLKLT